MAGIVHIASDLARTFYTGAKTVGTTPVQLTVGLDIQKGIRIKAPSSNSGIVYVTRQGGTTATGFPLDAGDEVFIPVGEIPDIYLVASQVSQEIRWLAA